MSTPTDSSDRLAVLAAELGALGRRLDGMGAELLALRSAPAGPTPASGPEPVLPAAHPAPARAGARQLPPAAAPPVRRGHRWSMPSGARLLAWTGGGVTLLGVVLLLVLAASRGWFSPTARVVAGGVLGLALIGLSLRLHRRASSRTGAVAVAATGVATLYLVVAAAVSVVGILAAPVGVGLSLAVAAGGLALADRWRSELLAAGAAAGAALLVALLAQGPLLVALVLVLQVAAAPVVLRHRWTRLATATAVGPVLYGSVVAVLAENRPDHATTVVAVLGVLAAGLGLAVAARDRLPAARVAALVVAAPVPLLIAAAVLHGWAGAVLAVVAVLASAGVAALPGTGALLRRAALAVAAVALLEATAVALDGPTLTAVLLGQAIVLAVVVTARRRLPLVVAGGYGTLGTFAALISDAPLAALVVFPMWPYVEAPGQARTGALIAGLIVSALVLAFAVAFVLAAGRTGLVRPDASSARLWAPVGLVGLYGAAGIVVTGALLISPDRAGFVAGHAGVTVSWTVAALVLLARGISHPALRVTGLVLVAAAVAKLVAFDLVALDGIARVVAFLGAGLVLLAAGTRYARLVAEAGTEGTGRDDADRSSRPVRDGPATT